MQQVRLMIDFLDMKNLMKFAACCESVSPDAAVFKAEALDFGAMTGVTRKYTYILGRSGDNHRFGKQIIAITNFREQTETERVDAARAQVTEESDE